MFHGLRKRFTGFALGTLLAASVACTGATTSGTPAPSGVGKPKVDRLLIAMPSPATEGNNPNAELDPLTVFQLRPMLEWLVGYAPDGAFEPMLATEWKVDPDGRSLTFKLRQGVPFHGDVGAFGAQDVVYAWEQITRPESTHPHAEAHRVVKVEVVNDSEVVFRLPRPNAEYLNQLSRQSGGFAITSKRDADTLGKDVTLATRPLASTGPYQFKARETGRFISFTRVPGKHYRAAPDFPELELRWVREASTRLASLLSGEIHATILPQDLTPEAESKGFKVLQGPISAQRTFLTFYGVYLRNGADVSQGYVHNDVAVADVRVRKALNRAIDRAAINKAFFRGKAEPMYIDKMPRKAPYFNPAWEQNFQREYGYDVEAAKALLAEAGYRPGNPLKLRMRMETLPDYGGSEDIQEAIAGMWRAVGVETEMLTIQASEFRPVNDRLGWKDLVSISATSNFDIQGWRVYNSSVPPRSSLEHQELDPVVRELLQTMDEKRQHELLRKLGDTAFSLHTNVPLFWLPAEIIIDPKVIQAWPYPGSVSRIFSHFDTIKAILQ